MKKKLLILKKIIRYAYMKIKIGVILLYKWLKRYFIKLSKCINLKNAKKFCVKNKFLILCIIISLIIGAIYVYQNRDMSSIKVCESAVDYNKGIGLTFHIGKDGETIETIEKNDAVTIDFIKYNLHKDDKESRAILKEYKDNSRFIFNETVKKYKDLTWFDAKLEEDENSIRITYYFDVNDKLFDYKKAKNVLEEFSLQYYYDKGKNDFIFDEQKFLSNETPLGTIENIKCTTLHSNKKHKTNKNTNKAKEDTKENIKK